MSSGVTRPKKSKPGGLFKDEDFGSAEIKKLVEEAQYCQEYVDQLHERVQKEKFELQNKYDKLKDSVYEKRDEYIKTIPKFWLRCFINHPRISPLINKENSDWLQYLTRFRVEDSDRTKSAFKISLFFSDNPHFANEVLTKEFSLEENGEYSSKSTPIDWKGENPLNKSSNSLDRKKKLEDHGFFDWFVNDKNPCTELPGLLHILWLKPAQYFARKTDNDDSLSLLFGCDDEIETNNDDYDNNNDEDYSDEEEEADGGNEDYEDEAEDSTDDEDSDDEDDDLDEHMD